MKSGTLITVAGFAGVAVLLYWTTKGGKADYVAAPAQPQQPTNQAPGSAPYSTSTTPAASAPSNNGDSVINWAYRAAVNQLQLEQAEAGGGPLNLPRQRTCMSMYEGRQGQPWDAYRRATREQGQCVGPVE